MNTRDHNVSDTERDSANAEGKRDVRNSKGEAIPNQICTLKTHITW